MSFIPRSLFGRITALIVAVLITSQIITVLLFRYYRVDIIAQQASNALSSHVQSLRYAMESLEPKKRARFVQEMQKDEENIRIFPISQVPAPTKVVEFVMGSKIAEVLRHKLGEQTQVVTTFNNSPALWVKMNVAGEGYWVVFPVTRFEFESPWSLFGLIGACVLVAIGGTFLFAWRMNRPLKKLSKAAVGFGQGALPEPIEVSGPEEVQVLAQSFNQMMRDIKQHEADRALMLAGVSHDLRTPLSRMRLSVEMMHDDSLSVGMIEDLEDMDRIIHQFLAFVREGSEETGEMINLNELIEGLCGRYQRMGKHIETHLAPLPLLKLKPTAIQRLLTNLIDNALRYGAEPLTIETRIVHDKVWLSVLDCGPGIPAHEEARLLQPFTRLEQARSGVSGSGLGLAIVDRIVKMHGGEIKLLPRKTGGLEARVVLNLT